MNYSDIILKYRGTFAKLPLDERFKALNRLFLELKINGFTRKDFTPEISDKVANVISEGSTIPETIKDNLKPYIIYMIASEANTIDGEIAQSKKQKRKQEEEDLLPLDDVDSIEDMKPEHFKKAEWDVEFMKLLGMETPDE